MELIDRAIGFLHEGWVRGAAHTTEGYCVLGALHAAANYQDRLLSSTEAQQRNADLDWARAAVLEQIRRTTPHVGDIAVWNDRYAEDADEVIGVLKLANEQVDTTRERMEVRFGTH